MADKSDLKYLGLATANGIGAIGDTISEAREKRKPRGSSDSSEKPIVPGRPSGGLLWKEENLASTEPIEPKKRRKAQAEAVEVATKQ